MFAVDVWTNGTYTGKDYKTFATKSEAHDYMRRLANTAISRKLVKRSIVLFDFDDEDSISGTLRVIDDFVGIETVTTHSPIERWRVDPRKGLITK